VATRGRYPAELGLDATLRPPDRPAATATLRGDGTLDELSVRLAVESPYALDVDLVVADVLGSASLDGTLRARLVPAEVGLDGARQIERLVSAERDGPGALRLAGQVDLGGEVSAALDGEWSALRWPLVGEPIAASPRGTIELRGTPAALEARLAAGWDANGRLDGDVRRDRARIDMGLHWRSQSRRPDGAP